MLGDIVRQTLNGEESIEVLVEAAEQGELVQAVRDTRADVVVLGIPDADAAAVFPPLFSEFPRLTVITITPDGQSVNLYDLRLRHRVLAEVRPRDLVSAIRGAVAAEGTWPAEAGE